MIWVEEMAILTPRYERQLFQGSGLLNEVILFSSSLVKKTNVVARKVMSAGVIQDLEKVAVPL